jgi:hypothetical protein
LKKIKEIINKLEKDLEFNQKMLPKNPISDHPQFFLLSRIGYIKDLLEWIKNKEN